MSRSAWGNLRDDGDHQEQRQPHVRLPFDTAHNQHDCGQNYRRTRSEHYRRAPANIDV